MSHILLVTAQPISPSACASEACGARPSGVEFAKTFAKLTCGYAAKVAQRVEGELDTQPSTSWTRRQLVLLRAAATPFIEAVTFIPTKPEASQILFACRHPERNAALFVPPFEQNSSPKACRVLQDDASVERQTRHLDASFVAAVRRVLEAFLKDPQTKAIALTLPSLGGRVITEIWSKSF